MSNRFIVTVDGSAASGKTALARLLAEALGFQHLNSGLLYRGVALLALRHHVAVSDEESIRALVRESPLSLRVGEQGQCELFLGESPCDADLSASEISSMASKVAALPGVRSDLLFAQREAFPGFGIVAEGRDMGSIVFPDAPVKFFVDARLDVRGKRRLEQMIARGEKTDLERVMSELTLRDEHDATREHAPMIKTSDAIVIDNSDRSLAETVSDMVAQVKGARTQW